MEDPFKPKKPKWELSRFGQTFLICLVLGAIFLEWKNTEWQKENPCWSVWSGSDSDCYLRRARGY